MAQTKLFEGSSSGNNNGSYYILKLTNEVSYSEVTIRGIKDLVGESDDLYPGIEMWLGKKVLPGIKEGTRYAYLVIHEGKPVAEAIVKRGADTKLCSMRIKPAYQNKAIGPILFAQIANLLESSTSDLHFTAPESLVLEREGMFQKLGFQNRGQTSRIYRPGEDEFFFKAKANNFKRRAIKLLTESQEHQSVLGQLEHSNELDPIVMSIKPQFASKIVNHKKTVEIRAKFSPKLVGATVFLYASSPRQAVVGEAKIASVVEGKPKEIWGLYGDQIGTTLTDFKFYCRGRRSIYALVLEEVLAYPDSLPWNVFSTAFNAPMRPPQSYQFIRPTGFARANKVKNISLSAYKKYEAEQIPMF